jgi:hypothetical protein
MKGKGDPRKDVVEGVAVKAARFLRQCSAYKQQSLSSLLNPSDHSSWTQDARKALPRVRINFRGGASSRWTPGSKLP